MKDSGLQVFSARMRPRVKALYFLVLVTAAVVCHGQGSILSLSLSMEGVLRVSNQSAAVLVCTVIHNSSVTTTFFYLNHTKLWEKDNAFIDDGTLTLTHHNESCYEEPPPPTKCEEVVLIIRTAPRLNNTLISCETRARNPLNSPKHEKSVIFIITEPDAPTTFTPTTSTSSATHSVSSVIPSPTGEPTVNRPSVAEKNTSAIFPEGRERLYVVAIGSETILLIVSLCVTIFLLIVLCKKKKVQQKFDLVQARSMSPEAAEERQLDEKPSSHHKPSSPTQGRLEGDEPRYTQCSHV